MTKEQIREEIAEIIDLKSIVSFDSKKKQKQKEDNLELVAQILLIEVYKGVTIGDLIEKCLPRQGKEKKNA